MRGTHGEGALCAGADQRRPPALYRFDKRCATGDCRCAALGNTETRLSINFRRQHRLSARAVHSQHHGRPGRTGTTEPADFQALESENIADNPSPLCILREPHANFDSLTAIDDFGAGYSGAESCWLFQPDLIKLSMALIRDVDQVICPAGHRQGIMSPSVNVQELLSSPSIREVLRRRASCPTCGILL